MTFALVLATAAAPIVATPLANKKAESTIDAAVVANQNVGVEVKLLNMPKTGVVGKQLKIPAGSAEAGTKITARLKDSAGRTVLNLTYDGSKTYKNGTELTESEVQQLVSNESGNVFYLYTPSKADDYVLSYTATKEGCLDTTSEGYIISVANSSATMEFASNTAFLIPEKVKSSQSVVLPNPTVTVNDAKIEGTSALTVTAKNPKDETVKLSTITIDGESHYVFTPTANVEGEYVPVDLEEVREAGRGDVNQSEHRLRIGQPRTVSRHDVSDRGPEVTVPVLLVHHDDYFTGFAADVRQQALSLVLAGDRGRSESDHTDCV